MTIHRTLIGRGVIGVCVSETVVRGVSAAADCRTLQHDGSERRAYILSSVPSLCIF